MSHALSSGHSNTVGFDVVSGLDKKERARVFREVDWPECGPSRTVCVATPTLSRHGPRRSVVAPLAGGGGAGGKRVEGEGPT